MSWRYDKVPFNTLLGKVFQHVEMTGDELLFVVSETEQYMLYHSQDCCETVEIESIEGTLTDLVGSPITLAEEAKSEGPALDLYSTWSFYKLATVKGYLDVRFFGTSNGYYSEEAELYLLKEKGKKL